ncbi:ArsR/SmtB family transcription factor [Fusibacter ferrireducens]|nr:metalloregulator ArsR/SmtB family transcription factor [Fusibacter ferrireducens]
MIDILKALSDENRLRIINLLANQMLCVCELEVLLDMNQSNVSRHLGKLKSAGIIVSTKEAQWVRYVIDESFKASHGLLLEYLKSQFEEESVYQMDLEKLSTYKDSDLTCQMITEDKLNVIKVLSATKLK